jgi:hypothetical protein
MERPNFAAILDSKLKSARYIDPGYLNANSVWEVDTEAENLIVRLSRLTPTPEGAFWNGLKHLFNSYPYSDMDSLGNLTDFVRLHSELDVPRIELIDTSMVKLSQKYMIVERLPGSSPVKGKISAAVAGELGSYLGHLHKASFNTWGNFHHSKRYEPSLWALRLSDTLAFLACGWFADNSQVQELLPAFQATALRLPAPSALGLIMPDLFWSQFLESDGNLTAVVDIEAMVIGPIELDLLNAEYLLEEPVVPSFVEGYRRHLPLPDLQAVRSLYRFLYYLMEVEETYTFDQWMNYPVLL